MEFVLEVEELFTLALEHLPYGNARPARDDIGDILSPDFLTYHRTFLTLSCGELGLCGCDLCLLLLELAIADLCYLAVVADLLGTLSLEAKTLDVYLSLLDTIDELLLTHPLGLVGGLLLLEGSDLLI